MPATLMYPLVNIKFLIPCISLLAGFMPVRALADLPPGYEFTFLASPMYWATDINNDGDISGLTQGRQPLAQEDSGIVYLDTAGSRYADTQAINNQGQVVGSLYSTLVRPIYTAVVWNDAIPTKLENLTEDGSSLAYGINDSGQVVGHSLGAAVDGFRPTLPTVWHGVTPTQLTLPAGGLGGTAYDINNSGQIAGWVGNQAVRWDGDAVTVLYPSDSGAAFAYAINDAGQVVGESYIQDIPNIPSHATLWSDGEMIDLGTLGNIPDHYSVAMDINNVGQVVGVSDSLNSAIGRATLWDQGQIYDLNSFLDSATRQAGWQLFSAVAINDKGQIIGVASNGSSFGSYLLTPVPEPETYALLMAGLGLIGLAARKRKCQEAEPGLHAA